MSQQWDETILTETSVHSSTDSVSETLGVFQANASVSEPSVSEHSLLKAQQSYWANAKSRTILPQTETEGDSSRLVMKRGERYQWIRPLGEGAVGEVMLAHDNDIKRKVAVKRLKKKHHSTSSLLRFVEEVRTIGQMDHPGIVPVHDVGVDEDGQLFFVMKYAEGDTMEHVIQKLQEGDASYHERFPLYVRNQIFLKILQVMQYAHSEGWLHRDLKPANIMVGRFGEVMVMDWGLVKKLSLRPQEHTDSQETLFRSLGKPESPEASEQINKILETQQNVLIGTPAYMSPEQALGSHHMLDFRSDVYSLSALYYEWIGLRHYMHHKKSLREMLFGVIHEEPELLVAVKNPHQDAVAVEFCHFVRKGLAKNPEERFQSAEQMRLSLQKVLVGQFPVQCPVTLTKRATNETLRFTDRHPIVAITSLLLVLGCAITGAMVLSMSLFSQFLS